MVSLKLGLFFYQNFKNLWEYESFFYRRLITEFPTKNWKKTNIERLSAKVANKRPNHCSD